METQARNLPKLIGGRFLHTKRRGSATVLCGNRLVKDARLVPASSVVKMDRRCCSSWAANTVARLLASAFVRWLLKGSSGSCLFCGSQSLSSFVLPAET